MVLEHVDRPFFVVDQFLLTVGNATFLLFFYESLNILLFAHWFIRFLQCYCTLYSTVLRSYVSFCFLEFRIIILIYFCRKSLAWNWFLFTFIIVVLILDEETRLFNMSTLKFMLFNRCLWLLIKNEILFHYYLRILLIHTLRSDFFLLKFRELLVEVKELFEGRTVFNWRDQCKLLQIHLQELPPVLDEAMRAPFRGVMDVLQVHKRLHVEDAWTCGVLYIWVHADQGGVKLTEGLVLLTHSPLLTVELHAQDVLSVLSVVNRVQVNASLLNADVQRQCEE